MTLALNNLMFSRNDIPLFRQIECTLQKGEMLQICGANGSGKSTLLRMIAGYIEPETGAVLWQNQSIVEQRDTYAQQICYLGHQNGLKPYLTVFENLKLSAALMQHTVSGQQIHTILHKMGLEHAQQKQVTHLSAGQMRRLALARLQLSTTKLWILDEPTTALDVAGQALFNDLLNRHLAQGGLAVVATHHDFAVERAVKTLQLHTSVSCVL